MEELTDEAKDMLDALKADESPTKASSDRMWTAVAAGGATATLLAGLGKGKLLLLGALGVTGVAALVFAMRPDEPPATPRGPAVAVEAGSPALEPRPVPSPALEAPPVTAPPEEVEPVPVQPEADRDPAPGVAPGVGPEDSGAKKATSKASAEPPVAGDLERELSLLGEVKVAMGAGETEQALSLLAKHRKDFPRSSFAQERELLRMTALCDAGKKEQARRLAEQFLDRNPSSALTPRVKKVCSEG